MLMFTLDGKVIAYNPATIFEVQVGHGSKGAYKRKYRFVGNPAQAVMYYNALNIGNGHKKRLYCPDFNKPVLARAFS